MLPVKVIELMFSRVLREGICVVVYCHPYEFSPGEVFGYRSNVPLWYKFHQNIGRSSIQNKLRAVFDRFAFGRLDGVLDAWVQA